jgi:hypothetical protein
MIYENREIQKPSFSKKPGFYIFTNDLGLLYVGCVAARVQHPFFKGLVRYELRYNAPYNTTISNRHRRGNEVETFHETSLPRVSSNA